MRKDSTQEDGEVVHGTRAEVQMMRRMLKRGQKREIKKKQMNHIIQESTSNEDQDCDVNGILERSMVS